jgi:hypothetical protein
MYVVYVKVDLRFDSFFSKSSGRPEAHRCIYTSEESFTDWWNGAERRDPGGNTPWLWRAQARHAAPASW